MKLYTAKQPKITCRWQGECSHNAENIIIYGCINQHVIEYALCQNHTYSWTDIEQHTGIFCPQCEVRTEPCYQITPLYNITPNYIEEYIRNTYQPHSREPYLSWR